MSQEESNPPSIVTNADVQARFDQGMRDGAANFTPWQAARGFAGSFTLTFLAASAFFPLLSLAATGGAAESVVLTWLAGLGSNALAGWLATWSERETKKLLSRDKVQERALIEQLAVDLQAQLAGDEALREDLARMLDQTDGISTAIASLTLQADSQAKLIDAIRVDIRQSNLIQGRLHELLVRQLDEAEVRITGKIASESSFIRDEVRLHAEEIHARLDILPSMDTKLDTVGPKLDAILRMISRGDALSSSKGAQDTLEAQINIARKLVQESHFVAARKILIELQEQAGENVIAPEVRARIANLLGACAFGTGELQVAQSYFDEAMTLAPNNVGMIANSAMVALLSDKPEAALELSTRALTLDRKEPNATSIYIQALYQLERQEELESLLKDEPWITEHAVGAAALASIKYGLGKYEEAEALLRRAIDLDTSEPQLHMLLANTIIALLAPELTGAVVLDKQTSERLKEVEKSFSQAVALYERGDTRASLHAALVSRAGIRCIQGELKEGITDCDRVLSEDAKNRGALENKGRILLKQHRETEAIACFEELLNHPSEKMLRKGHYKVHFIGGNESNIPALLASAYINVGKFHKAIELLSPLFMPAPDDRDQLDIAEVLLVAQSKTYDHPAVADTLRIIERTWPQEPEAKAIVAEHLARQGKYAQAIRKLWEAVGLAESSLRGSLTARIAYLLYQEKQYAEAADVLGPIVKKDHDNPDLRLYIVCLYNSQQLAEALPFAQFIRSTTGVVPGISEIEALILEKGGDIQQARQLWQQLIQAEPTTVSYQVNAAYAEWRAGNREAAQQLTIGIPYERVKDNATLLINIARLRAFLKLPDVLVFAYQARRIAFDNPDIHVQYMMLCMHTGEAESSNAQMIPEEVGLDTAVHLIRNGKTSIFLITGDEDTQKHQSEIHINDSLARKLLGKRVGDHIVLQESFMEAPEYEITEIQGKYLYASHQTTYMFEKGEIRHQDFYVDDVTDPDFMERFARFLDRRAQFQPDIQTLYTEQNLPLSTFAHLIGRSIIDVWMAFIESPGERLFSATGTSVEAERQRQIVAASTSVVVDLLSLLTIAHLSLEEVVAQRFDAILMPQALQEQLQDYEQELDGPQPHGTIGSSRGHRYFLELPPEYVERKRELLNRVLIFVRNTVQIYPTMGLIEAEQELMGALGEAATASILLAKEQDVALYSDDLRIRRIAEQHWLVKGFDSQTILDDVRERAILSDDGYHNALNKLVQSNYHFIRINTKTLVFILEQNGMSITEEVRNLFKLLHGPDSAPDTATLIIAELIKRIWIRPMLQSRKFFILDLALTTLFTGRRPATVIPTLKVQLRQQFRLIEFLLPEVLAHVDYWARQPLP